MNILYLKEEELGIPLHRSDARYSHITKVLKKKEGDSLAAGCSNGSLGNARIERLDRDSVLLSFTSEHEAPALYPVNLLMGFPRPIQAGRILKDLTSLGLQRIWFTLSELGEKSYAESTFFRTRDFESHLIEGAMQAGNPRLPQVDCFWSLSRACDAIDAAQRGASSQGETAAFDSSNLSETSRHGAISNDISRIVFHPGEKLPKLADFALLKTPLWLAIGSERGWTDAELDVLRSRGFVACSLGQRILKTETAALAAASIVLSRIELL
ncbi:MAG: 16S rRNA (uracil(1498)-N(3))-methyltransferase [Spirochaetia bacterium]|jgi:RsmE family RNA methyltransferase|nr:16S rRNA (uracil(1498)-N(3))-methyltransferase [Spirochaetia bacterium]